MNAAAEYDAAYDAYYSALDANMATLDAAHAAFAAEYGRLCGGWADEGDAYDAYFEANKVAILALSDAHAKANKVLLKSFMKANKIARAAGLADAANMER